MVLNSECVYSTESSDNLWHDKYEAWSEVFSCIYWKRCGYLEKKVSIISENTSEICWATHKPIVIVDVLIAIALNSLCLQKHVSLEAYESSHLS